MEKITFTTGPMGSGKSAELIELYEKDDTRKICFSASLDKKTGYKNKISSRNGKEIDSISLSIKDEPEKIVKKIVDLILLLDIQTVYIDEIQFFEYITIKEICKIPKEHNIIINLYGLKTTFAGKYFNSSLYLLTVLFDENLREIKMLCQEDNCINFAEHNARIINGKIVKSGETFLEEKSTYKSLCLEHYKS